MRRPDSQRQNQYAAGSLLVTPDSLVVYDPHPGKAVDVAVVDEVMS